MGIIEKLDTVITDIKIELEMSLPICNRENEIVFFYNIKESDRNSYRIGRIYNIYVLEKSTGELKEAPVEKMLTAELISKMGNAVIHPSLLGDEAVEAEEDYLDNYEEFSAVMYKEGQGIDLIKRVKCFFEKYLSDEILASIYHHLGKEMFEYMEKNI